MEILAAVEELRALGAGQNYTRNPLLCGSWRLVFTTEKAREMGTERFINTVL